MKIEIPSRLAVEVCGGVEFMIDGEWTPNLLCDGIDLSTVESTIILVDRIDPLTAEPRREVIRGPFRIRFKPQYHDDPELLLFVANAVVLGCEWGPDTMTLSGPGRRAA